jgi:alkaline phosphatase D
MQRRDFLTGASQMAALMAWQNLFAKPSRPKAEPAQVTDWTAPPETFSLGVASGEPMPDGFVIWTRLAPKPLQEDGGMPAQAVRVQWQVSRDARFTKVVQQGEFLTDPAKAHCVHVQLEGLDSAQHYHYRFSAGGQESPIGRTRTAPALDADPGSLRFALSSCQHYEQGYFTAHREIAATDLDFVLFVGDYIYESPTHRRSLVRHHAVQVEDVYSLDLYRIHHASYKLDGDLRACHAAHPWLMTWDDHEVRNDYDGSHDSEGDLSPEDFLKRRAMAYQAYFEHLPISPKRAPVGPDATFYTQYTWGKLAQLWLLDTRQWRAAQVCNDAIHAPWRARLLWQCKPTEAPERSMLGQAQERWLADTLASSTSAWRLIGQTTQLTPGGFGTPLGPLLYADGWDAFPAARERLLAAIAQPRVPDVVVLGGDVHRHVAANLRQRPGDPSSPIIASEIVGSSITSRGLSEVLNQWMRRSNPDILHSRSDERGYALVDITAKRLRCDFRATAHPVKADASFHTQASFVIDRGVPGLRRV